MTIGVFEELAFEDIASSGSPGSVQFTFTLAVAAGQSSVRQDPYQCSAYEVLSYNFDANLGWSEVEAALAARPKFTRSIFIHDLNTEVIELLMPLQAEIEAYAEEVIAKIPELDVWATSDTESEAILLLKKEIRDLWTDLNEADEASLGKLPRMWKRILSGHIQVCANA